MIQSTPLFPRTENEIGAAARRQCQSILGDILWPMQLDQIKRTMPSSDISVIDIACGSGTTSAGVLESGRAESLHSFDFDPVNIETTKRKLDSTYHTGPYEFHVERFEDSTLNSQVDLIIGASVLNDVESCQAIMKKAWECLTPGGALLLDFIDFSGSQGFPRSYALDQYNEYMHLYQEVLRLELTTSGIQTLAKEQRFDQVSVETMIPRFLEPKHRKLPSLILEYLTSFIVDNAVSSQVELEAIISELRHLAGRPEMMISGPMTFQLYAIKS